MNIGELTPVAWIEHSKLLKSDWVDFDKGACWNEHSPLYSKQQLESAVAHAIEATKEKAAKVCEELDVLMEHTDGSMWPCDQFDCAAAIRSMK